jgi:GTP cyclohydrolase I
MEIINPTAQDLEYPVNSPEWHVQQILIAIGENPYREGLQKTPERYINFLKEFLSPPPFAFTTFTDTTIDEMIIQTNIPFYSLCEHHIAPFFGTATIAYIPNGKIIGLSKLARVLDLYANRLQNQERITQQTTQRLMDELQPKGAAVSLKAQHLCMNMRGVKKHDTYTTTTSLSGAFKSNPLARSEFLNFIS